ncbi:MAG: hypothetical protein ACTSU7_00135 [Candidatus Heimdallarchaeaceae archaeon]
MDKRLQKEIVKKCDKMGNNLINQALLMKNLGRSLEHSYNKNDLTNADKLLKKYIKAFEKFNEEMKGGLTK